MKITENRLTNLSVFVSIDKCRQLRLFMSNKDIAAQIDVRNFEYRFSGWETGARLEAEAIELNSWLPQPAPVARETAHRPTAPPR